ncbi:MAG: aspartyl/glutamyl-tRNA amidotransferase subunit C [Gemmatimonadetes bacterium]|nr:aspartyl/glutamyl-tRNA amidotransferase subunit C [Gemmatimonadota bacterium]
MRIAPDDVRHVADLARVGLEPDRIAQLARELSGILDHMDVLARVVPPDTVPMDGAPGVTSVLRDDVAAADPLLRAREAIAPEMRDGLFLVPRLAAHEDAGA